MSLSPAAPRLRLRSLLQLLLSLGGSGVCALCAVGLLLYDLLGSNGSQRLLERGADLMQMAWIFAFLAALGLPSAWYAARDLAGRPAPAPAGRGRFVAATSALALWPLALLAGNFVADNAAISRYLLPPLTTLASVIPIWWLVEVARRGLKPASPQRSWGLLNFALYVSNPAAMVAELLLLVLIVAGVLLAAMSIPSFSAQILQFSRDFQQFANDPQRLRQMITPYMTHPLVIAGGLGLSAVLVPLLEEIFKPLAVWLLVGRETSAADGLAGGAIAGAAFALTETLFNIASLHTPGNWVGEVVGRAGTAMLHVTTAALIGMSITAAWRNRRFGWPLLAYLVSAALHGLWNAFSVLAGLAQRLLPDRFAANLFSSLAVGGLMLLALVFLGALLYANRRVRLAGKVQNVAAAPILPG